MTGVDSLKEIVKNKLGSIAIDSFWGKVIVTFQNGEPKLYEISVTIKEEVEK